MEIILQWILHDWSDEDCTKILQSCWKALPEKGKLILVEYVLPMIPEPNLTSQSVFPMDVGMMINFGGSDLPFCFVMGTSILRLLRF